MPLFGYNLSGLSSSSRLGIGVAGVFVFYLANGYATEAVFQFPNFEYAVLLTLFQYATYATLAYVQLLRLEPGFLNKEIPWRDYMLTALAMVATQAPSNHALSFLPYPVHQLFKSCKLIPVMIGGRLINKRSYSHAEVLSALLLTLGLIILTLEKTDLQGNELSLSIAGLLFVSFGLLADGFYGNLQERTMHERKVSQTELLFFTHFIGLVLLTFVLFTTGQAQASFQYAFVTHPNVVVWFFIYAITGYAGIAFVLLLIEYFGSFVAMTVTSSRKFVSISLSFLFFPKNLTGHFLAAAFCVFSGLFIQIYAKNQAEVARLCGRPTGLNESILPVTDKREADEIRSV